MLNIDNCNVIFLQYNIAKVQKLSETEYIEEVTELVEMINSVIEKYGNITTFVIEDMIHDITRSHRGEKCDTPKAMITAIYKTI